MKHFSVNLLWKDFLQKYESSSCHHDAYLHLTDRTQKHDAGVNGHSTTAFAQGNAAQSRHGARTRGREAGGTAAQKTKARQSGTLLRKTYPPLSEGGGDQSGAMSSNDV